MASVLHPAIVMPGTEPRAFAALPATPRNDADAPHLLDDDSYEPIADMARELARALEADGLRVTWHDRDGATTTLFAIGTGDDATATVAAAGAARIIAAHETTARSEWTTLEASDAAASRGLMTLSIPTGGGVVVIAALFQRPGDGTRNRAREIAAHWLPMVQPFFALWSTWLGATSHRRGLIEAVNDSDIGILLVNARGQLTFVNTAAQSLIDRNDGLRRNGALLSGSRLSDTLRLQAAIEHVVGGGVESARNPAPVVAVNRRDRRPLLVAIIASEVPPVGADDCAAIVHVFDPEQDLRGPIEPACKLYGLSPVETRLTCLLADGVSLADAAVAMHVREQTARSYLKQVFLKTETNRQAELVWLMLKSAVRTAPGCRTSFI